ncbi:MAG: glycosyl hydrolase family 88 [Oscillospiraceae bacterium]|nr:glycosyl hydrolase family 88 [Oscillospiraceae bacterium]
MNDSAGIFREKAELLCGCLLSGGSFAQLAEKTSAAVCAGYAAFVSVCDGSERARVFRCAAPEPEAAWRGACEAAERYVSAGDVNPKWVKADIVVKSNTAPLSYVLGRLANGFHEFFRRGIAFGDTMDNALIEAEINGNRLLAYKEQTIKLPTLNKYFSANGIKTLTVLPDSIILFDCISAFCDENSAVYPLYGEGHRAGRRVIDGITKELLLHVITTSSDYLAMMVGFDGKFDYGYYPIFHKEIPGYNILRHSSSIWSLICAYRITGDKFTLRQIETSIGYMISNTVYKYRPSPDRENTVFLADKSKNEVKIGGNAVAIIMLTEYMNALDSGKYVKLCRELGNGILELFDMNTGRFFHVLNYPQFTPKEEFRTVYYDGETVFALCRLYGLTGEQRWLDAAKRAADRFIEEDYTRHRDHWVAYAMNELTKFLPEDRYLSFALKNANVNLKAIYERVTTYHTYLELLTVTFELYDRVVSENLPCSYLSEFDAKFFVKTIYHRAEWMLNGYAYPEYVMYFKYPERALGAFFVRHDGYRIRIDDIQHFCGAYYSFYRNYEKLEALKNSFGITEP